MKRLLGLGACLWAAVAFSANTPFATYVQALSAASTPGGTELIPVYQGSAMVKMTPNQILAWITANSQSWSGTQTIAALTVTGAVTFSGLGSGTQVSCLGLTSANVLVPSTGACGTGSAAFSSLTSGTNTSAAMLIGTGASLQYTGSGEINSNYLLNYPLPSLTSGYLEWTGSAWAFGNPSGSGTVTDGSGTSTANEVAVSTSTAHVLSYVTVSGCLQVSGGVLSSPGNINAQTGTSYSIASTDACKLVTFSNTSAIAVTLPQATGSFAAGFQFDVANYNTGLVTITPTTSTINGASTLTVPKGLSCEITSDGTNYQVSLCTAAITTLPGLTSANGSTIPASAGTLPGSTGSFTIGHCLEVGATSPLEIEDNGSACGSGSGGTVTDGSGTSTANELLASTNTAHTYSVVATLPTAAVPAFTGDMTNSSGSLATTVNAIKGIAVAVATASSSTSVTPNCTNAFTKVTASATGTFTINAPGTCTPFDGQKLELKIISPSGGTITYSWNAAYLASATLALPTTSNAASKEDYFEFQYDADKSGWVFLADNQGF
jgi:hypothetical protein